MLTSKQRAFLKSEAHSLKPIVQIGKNGLNDQIKTSVRNALDARELIKVTLCKTRMKIYMRLLKFWKMRLVWRPSLKLDAF